MINTATLPLVTNEEIKTIAERATDQELDQMIEILEQHNDSMDKLEDQFLVEMNGITDAGSTSLNSLNRELEQLDIATKEGLETDSLEDARAAIVNN